MKPGGVLVSTWTMHPYKENKIRDAIPFVCVPLTSEQ